ncbi:hypothetical protein [Pandoraea sp. PE-S2T-3]|uniref:hypothetical protein n=1 Tax=Pandoraea sp. PE-S2T-3 TaxID=1986993 RepID=UPI000B3FB541|nr:hypothetical protein [Pandoraea sp. PE-S2T-3]
MDTKSDERATIIHTFKVTVSSGGERTYNNGLCQVRLEIELIADKNLSPAETATLRVVDGNSEQEVPLVDSSMPVPIGTWGSSLAKNVYEFHPGGADIAVENREFLHYYVQTADFANARKTIGMRITLENNQEIFSKNISHSDGTVDLIPVAPVSPPFSAWNQDWEQTHKYTVGSNIKVTIYYLGLVLATGARQAMRTMEVAPASFASSYKWLSPNSQSGAFCGYAEPPTDQQPTPEFVYSQVQYTGAFRVAKNDWPRVACAAIAFVANDSLGPYQGAANAQGCTYTLRDQYGTPYRVRVNITPACDALTLSQA